MSRYIDADATRDLLIRSISLTNGIDTALKDAPTIDIVRCKECKWSKVYWVKADNSTRMCCDNYLGLDHDIDADDFCSYGERKESE